MNHKRFTLAALTVIAGAAVLFLGACRAHGPHHGTPGKQAEFIIGRLKNELDLSQSQVDLLKDIQKQITQKIAENKPQWEQDFEFLKSQILSDSLDTGRIEQYMDSRQTGQQEVRDFILIQLKRFHDTLSTAQKQKLVALLEEMKGLWYNRAWPGKS
jgi:Spy/CpxP family protein refolding chaperone